jgi:hypothetical protein
MRRGWSGVENPRSFGAVAKGSAAVSPSPLPLSHGGHASPAAAPDEDGRRCGKEKAGELIAPRPFTQRTGYAASQTVNSNYGSAEAESNARRYCRLGPLIGAEDGGLTRTL